MIFLLGAIYGLLGLSSYAVYLVASRSIGSRLALIVMLMAGPIATLIVIAWLINDRKVRNRRIAITNG